MQKTRLSAMIAPLFISGLLLSNCTNPCDPDSVSAETPVNSRQAGILPFTPPAVQYVTLSQGSSGSAVTMMKTLLKIAVPEVTVSSTFDAATKSQVMKFQSRFNLESDGVVGRNTWRQLLQISKGYKQCMMFGKVIHIYETSSSEQVVPGLGVAGVREKLSVMKLGGVDNSAITAKINCGFFDTKRTGTESNPVSEHAGALMINGVITQEKLMDAWDVGQYVAFIHYNNGQSEVKRITVSDLTALKQTTRFVIGSGFSVVVKGKPYIDYSTQIGISPSQRTGRTLFGNKADGSFLLVVVDGASKANSTGITGQEGAAIMQELGAQNAVSFDGGGSSTMVTSFSTVRNTPSDGAERSIGSAIFVRKVNSQPYILGDIDGNGSVNSIDFALLRKHILGISEVSGVQAKAADVNSDGSINSIDFALMRQYILGIITKFPS